MKKNNCFIFLLLLLIPHLKAFCQSKQTDDDVQAQYLYLKAEDNLLRNQTIDCITNCEKAITKLGQPNRKIVLLMFNAYESLLTGNCCFNPILKDKSKINNYITYFFDSLDINTYPKENFFSAMKFKDDYNEYLKRGCPEPVYYSFQDLGIIFKPGTRIVKALTDGPVKSQTNMQLKFYIGTLWPQGDDPDYNNLSNEDKVTYDLHVAQRKAMETCQEKFDFIIPGFYWESHNSPQDPPYKITLPTIKK